MYAPQGPADRPGLRTVGARGAGVGPKLLAAPAARGGRGPDAGGGPGLPQEEPL